jgi:hydroxymethylpyrimidine pyrophosphatase-like HAD family hydrolase
MARKSVSVLPMPLTFIAHNGAVTMHADSDAPIETRHLPPQTAGVICDAFRETSCEPFLYVADGDACRLLHLPSPGNPALARYIAANESVCKPVADLMGSVDGARILHVVAIESSDRVRRALDTLPEFPDARLMTSGGLYGGEYWFLEAIHPAASKVDALRAVTSRWNLSLADTLAIGDNLNDLDMLAAVGCGVAMGNAPETVKAVADRVTASNDAEGVALALGDSTAR